MEGQTYAYYYCMNVERNGCTHMVETYKSLYAYNIYICIYEVANENGREKIKTSSIPNIREKYRYKWEEESKYVTNFNQISLQN